jgi:hypothetical protein
MKGLWKKNVSTWNKDSKRKKTKLKHILKDNFNFICKKVDTLPEKIYKEDLNLFLIANRKQLKFRLKNTNFKIPLYKLRIYNNSSFEQLLSTTFAYNKDNFWIEYKDNKLNTIGHINNKHIDEKFVGYINNPFYEENYKYNNELVESKLYYSNTKIYVYNKPFSFSEHGLIHKRYNSQKRYKKMINGISRARVKTWINKKDFDSELNRHPLEKSIKRLIS